MVAGTLLWTYLKGPQNCQEPDPWVLALPSGSTKLTQRDTEAEGHKQRDSEAERTEGEGH